MRRWIILLLAVTVVGVGSAVGYHKVLRWKRFAAVAPGVLYRSGILRDWQLRRAIRQYGIKTVFSFTHTKSDDVQRVCDEEGVRRYYCYLHGNGVGPNDPYLRFLQVVENPANQPVLVHCSAGVQRTGGAVTLFRVLMQDWPFDDAIREMIALGNDGEAVQIDQLRRLCQSLQRPTLANRSAINSER